MAELKPEIGLVIRSAYLWWNEARKGRDEGSKDRPCVIVHLRVNEHQELETYICPATHAPPEVPGLRPGAMTRDLVAQAKANAQDKSPLVVGRAE